MKTKKQADRKQEPVVYPIGTTMQPLQLHDYAFAPETGPQPMVRTQIYLTKSEHYFLQNEAARRGQPMAAVIRAFIDEKMEIPSDAWTNNPLLRPPADPDFVGPEDGVINHDHYIYGGPKKWVQQKGNWVEAPPLPQDYYTNPASATAYDRGLERKK